MISRVSRSRQQKKNNEMIFFRVLFSIRKRNEMRINFSVEELYRILISMYELIHYKIENQTYLNL